MKKILLIFGTRPEAIKLAPVYKELGKYSDDFDVRVCVTGQHRQMLDQVLELFDIKSDFDLNIMRDRQDLFDVTAGVLTGLRPVIRKYRPDLLIVHGDTTTTLAASIAGFYEKIPVAHVEAGLRTGDLDAPWPEEFNRRVAGIVTALHFAPTAKAKDNLLREGIRENSIFVTGNTVIDALFSTVKRIESKAELRRDLENRLPYFNLGRKCILLTGHRRENFGLGFENIFSAIKNIIKKFHDLDVIYPVHLNPNVREPAKRILEDEIKTRRVILIEPQDYVSFVYLMKSVDLIITDSGGVQEEAPSFGVPILVTREVTERPEAVDSKCVVLVGCAKEKIIHECTNALSQMEQRKKNKVINPYGDGRASEYIREAIQCYFRFKS